MKYDRNEERNRYGERVLSYQTIVQIFDKRQQIGSVKTLKSEFRSKRRHELVNNRPDKYRKLVLSYKKKIEDLLE